MKTRFVPSILSFIILVQISAAARSVEYRIEHCLSGCPVGSNSDSQLVLRPIYALAYNTEYKVADWVAYKVSAGTIGIASNLSRLPVTDNFISKTLEVSDFEGADEQGLVLSRFVPLVNFAGTPYWTDVNFLTNIVARSSNLNQGAWYGLEWAIRNLANRGTEVFIMTGPIYRNDGGELKLISAKRHKVPDAFFKIVMTNRNRGAAFILEQDTPVHVHHCDLIAEIAEVEIATGLDFFPNNQGAIIQSLDTNLGCR
jgi:endonuclease G